MESLTIQMIVAFIFGVAFVITLLLLAIKFPRPTDFQYNVFRIVLSLAAAGVGAMIPGFINIEVNPTVGFLIRAGGALAVFVIVFFFNPASLVKPKDGDTEQNFLSQFLDKLDSDLQDAFALAAMQARREQRNVVATHDLFEAFMRLQSGKKLSNLFRQIPSEALPLPINIEAKPDRSILKEPLTFSACITESLTKLSPNVSRTQKLSSEDMFIDIARYGKGESVRKLRTHGVSPEVIEGLVKQLGWRVVQRPV